MSKTLENRPMSVLNYCQKDINWRNHLKDKRDLEHKEPVLFELLELDVA